MDSQSARPPHLVFLIDTNLVSLQLEHDWISAINEIHSIMMRLMFYFLDRVDQRMTWGFRFYKSNVASVPMIHHPFHDVTETKLNEFKNKFLNQLKEDVQRSDDANNESKFGNLKSALMQILTEFHWVDQSILGASPSTPRTRSTSRGGVEIRNYLYIFTARPQTIEGLNDFVFGDGRRKKTNRRIKGDKDDITNVMRQELSHVQEAYIDRRISVSWIDKSFTKCQTEETSNESFLVVKQLQAVTDLFAGELIPAHLFEIENDRLGYSFSCLFQHYRQRKFDLHHYRQRKFNVQAPDYIYGTCIWKGEFIQAMPGEASRLCSVEIYSLFKEYFTNVAEDPSKRNDTDRFSMIQSINATSFLHSSEIPTNMLHSDNNLKVEVFSLTAADKDMGTFSMLMEFLRKFKLLIHVEFEQNGETSLQYGLIEPLASNFASLRLLNGSIPPVKSTLDLQSQPCSSGTLHFEYFNMPGISPIRELSVPAELHISMDCALNIRRQDKVSKYFSAKHQEQEQADQRSAESSKLKIAVNSTIKVNSIVALPSTIDELGTLLENLYMGTLYLKKHNLLEFMNNLNDCVNHVINPVVKLLEVPDLIIFLHRSALAYPDFEKKHNKSTADRRKPCTDNQAKDEHIFFIEWVTETQKHYNGNYSGFEEMTLKALQVREAKIQVAIHLMLSQLIRIDNQERRGERCAKNTSTVDEQLELLFDSILIWEETSLVGEFTRKLHSDSDDEKFQEKLDKADVDIREFCRNLAECYYQTSSAWVIRFWKKIAEPEDGLGTLQTRKFHETPNGEAKLITLAQRLGENPASISDGKELNSENDTPFKYPQKKSRGRISESSPHLQKNVVTSLRVKKQSPVLPSRQNTRPQSLPFMNREIEIGGSKQRKGKRQIGEATKAAISKVERSMIGGRPTIQRSGSFTKRVTSPKQPSVHAQTNTVVLRSRAPISPTTPRTRFAREFGLDTSSPNRRPVGTMSPSRHDRLLRSPSAMRIFKSPASTARFVPRDSILEIEPRRNLMGSLLESVTSKDKEAENIEARVSRFKNLFD